MQDANYRTLKTYSDGVQNYIKGTVPLTSGDQKDWLDFVFQAVSKSAKILEIGSAFGRDATYITQKGYELELTDGSTGFVDYLNGQGFSAKMLDIVNEAPKDEYDVILACAVFLHFTDSDFERAVANVKQGLKPDGRFAFSLKQGDSEEWTESKMGAPRYFNYWRKERLEGALATLGMRIINFQVLNNGKWLHIISEKETQA